MAAYLFKIISVLFVLFGFHLLCFESQLGRETQSHAWVEETYRVKEDICSRVKGSKLLLVGGSGTLFSVSADELQRRLGIPVVNFGVHAGVGPDYLLQRAARCLQAGDVVLLILEYNVYSYEGEVSETRADFLSAWDPGYLRENPRRYLETALSFSLPEILARCGSRAVDSGREGYYSATHLNATGDKENIGADLTSPIQREMLRLSKPLKLSFAEGSVGVAALDDFIKDAHSKRVQVLITFPTSLDFDEYRKPPPGEFLDDLKAFGSARGIQVLGTPWDFLYSDKYFIDTQYHANREGRQRATARLAELLEGHIGSLRPRALDSVK